LKLQVEVTLITRASIQLASKVKIYEIKLSVLKDGNNTVRMMKYDFLN